MLNFLVCYREVSPVLSANVADLFPQNYDCLQLNVVCGLCDLNVIGIIYTSQADISESFQKSPKHLIFELESLTESFICTMCLCVLCVLCIIKCVEGKSFFIAFKHSGKLPVTYKYKWQK